MDYKVQRGDTLSALAKRHGTTVDAIMDANTGHIVDRNKIYTGDTITIPGPAKAAKEAAAKVQPAAPDPAPAPQADATEGAAEVATATPPAPSMYEQPTTQVVYEVYASPVAPQPATTQVMGARSDDVQVVEVRPTAVTYEDNTYEQRVVDLVNQIRSQYGLPTLAYDARLDQGAEGHTAHQAAVGRMAHEGIGDGSPQDRMLAAGWNWAWGENAAVGQTTPEQVVAEWMASPGHRANILNGDFRFLSVGYGTSADGRPYWTQSFGAGA